MRCRTGTLILLLFFTLRTAAQENLNRFIGFHFDFHATLHDTAIGKTITPQLIDSFLTITKPDFIQVDCKGHPGISSYPTRVGTPAPGMEKDILKIFREETAKHHVKLYVHYSGVLDHQAVALHPSWARMNSDGYPDQNATSVFGSYVDSLMIPQLKELASAYKIDGAWVDGDCWALSPDYSTSATAGFRHQTGIAEAPKDAHDPNYFAWAEFNRKAFRDYVKHYVDAIHKADPAFRITSNWAFSSLMPEKVTIPVDFLSGDVAGNNGLYSSAFQSRCMALQGKPWDLMSWSFSWKNGLKATKSVPQIEQEAAEVLAMGGGYQTYWQQNRDGSLETYQFRKMAEIVKFCRDRKAFCFEGKVVPQIGLLYSTYTWRRLTGSNLYNGAGLNTLKSILNILLDSQLPVEVLMDHQLAGRLKQYPLIIIPEWPFLDPGIQKELMDYVEQGGNLLIIGAKAVQPFRQFLKVDFLPGSPEDTSFFAGYENHSIHIKTKLQRVKVDENTSGIGTALYADDFRFPAPLPLGSVEHLGKGKIAALYMDIGDFYDHNRNPFLKNIVKDMALKLFPDIKVQITGTEYVHTVITRKEGRLYVHLINTHGPHSNPDVMTYDEVDTVCNLKVGIRLPQRPKLIILQPACQTLPFQYRNGMAVVTVDKLPVYDILEVKE